MKIFVSGGAKSGKSMFAQRMAKALKKDKLYYIATMRPSDKEDSQRIKKHIEDRFGWGFETVEQFENIEEILGKTNVSGAFLLDSLTALTAGEMFSGGTINYNGGEKIIRGLSSLFEEINDIVIVSDYIYSDGFVYDEITEKYRKTLASIDRFCAENCEIVLECAYSQVIVHKGEKEFICINEKIS